MAGFTTVRFRDGVAFIKDDRYLCADPNLEHLMLDRQTAQQRETFVPVPQDRLRVALEFNQSPEKEMRRFSAAVARLVEMGLHVKVQVGCGHNPRPGYLNVDALWHKLDFGRSMARFEAWLLSSRQHAEPDRIDATQFPLCRGVQGGLHR